MTRPVEYDKQVVLEKAMEVFWLKGYESTSISDLIKATGLTSRSMYNIFGSKNGLFKAVLEKYYAWGLKGPMELLKNEEGLEAIRNYFETIFSVKPLNGCLMVNTFSEKNTVENDCQTIVRNHFENLESIFEKKLVYAKRNEGYEGNPKLRARQLVTVFHGIALYSKTGISVKEMKAQVKDFLIAFKI